MHDEAFADATRPTPRVILRLLMLDYSIGHELLLVARRNPLVVLSQDEFSLLPDREQRRAMIGAALICSNTWASNQKPHKWTRLWGWMIRKENFDLAIAEFRNYRAEGSRFPRIADPFAADEDSKEAGRQPGSPFLARLIVHLRKTNVPNDEIMDYPMGRATFEFLADLEDGGRVKVENDDERETREGVEKIEAEVRAEREKEKPCRD